MNYFLNNPIPTAAQMMKKYARGGEVVKGYARGGEFDGSIYDLAESYGIPVEYLMEIAAQPAVESIQPTYQEEPTFNYYTSTDFLQPIYNDYPPVESFQPTYENEPVYDYYSPVETTQPFYQDEPVFDYEGERRRVEEEARLAREAEDARRAEEEARTRREVEAARREQERIAAEQARLEQERQAEMQRQEEVRRQAELEAQRRAEAERIAAEQEAARVAEEEAARAQVPASPLQAAIEEPRETIMPVGDNEIITAPLTAVRESIMPTGEEESVREFTQPTYEEEKLTELTQPQESPLSYTVPGATLPVDVSSMDFDAGQKAMALMSLVDPAALSAMNFQVGDAAFGGGASGGPSTMDYYRNVAPDTVGGQGSFYEEGALEAFKEAAKDPTQGIFKSGFEALAGEPGIAEAIAAKTERDLGALAKVESDFDVMKPLSDLLKANKFKEAFDYAKDKGIEEKLMQSNWLAQLRQPFSAEEMQAFFKAMPSDFAGSKYNFMPEMGKQSAADSGYPDPQSVYQRKEDTTIKDIAKVGAALMFATAVPGLLGTAGAGAGTAGAGTGALGSLQAAGKALLALPETIGIQVGNALGASTLSTMQAKMIGNAIISGGITGAKGGDLEDIIKSAAMAAGLTYVSDKAIKAVTGALKNSGVIDAVKDIPGGDVAAVDPTVASNVANNVAQGLREFTVTTFTPSAAAAGLANVGAIAGGQAAAAPGREAVAPEDQIAAEYKQIYERPVTDFGTGLEIGAFTGSRGLSDQGVTPPPAPLEQVTVQTGPEKLDFSDPFIQSLVQQYGPSVAEPGYATPEEIAAGEIKVGGTPERLDVSSPLAVAAAQPGFATPEQIAKGEIPVSGTPDRLDASDLAIQTIMDRFEAAPINPATGMAEIPVTAEGLDLTDPVIQVLANRYDVKAPEPTPSMEEVVVQAKKPLSEELDFTPPTPIVVNPADIAKGYTPTEVKKSGLPSWLTPENLLRLAGLVGGIGGTAGGTTAPAGPVYDPRASATAGPWIDWEKVKADAAAAGMNLNTYVARNWNKIQNRALEAGMQPYTPSPAMVNPASLPSTPSQSADLNSSRDRFYRDMIAGGLSPEAAEKETAARYGSLNPASLPSTPSQSADLNSSRDRFYRDMIAGGLSPEAAEKETAARYGSLNPAMVNPNSLPGGGGMTFARGGALNRVAGPGSGRDDKIPALLSDGEYVIDAETMALLGDGSVDRAAELMDEFRENIRKHKGATLAKGGISPNAKSPLQYLRGI